MLSPLYLSIQPFPNPTNHNPKGTNKRINITKGILATIGCLFINIAIGEFNLLPQIYAYMVSYFHIYDKSISLAQMKYITMIYLVTQSITMALTFYLYNIFKYRGVFFLSIFCFSISQFISSQFTNYWLFLPFYSIIGGCAKAIYILPVYCVWRYFPAKYKPILSGIMLSGNALSSAPSSALAHWYINPEDKQPVNTPDGDFFPEDVARNVPKFFRLLGVVSFCLGMVGILLVTEPVEELDQTDFVAAAKDVSNSLDFESEYLLTSKEPREAEERRKMNKEEQSGLLRRTSAKEKENGEGDKQSYQKDEEDDGNNIDEEYELDDIPGHHEKQHKRTLDHPPSLPRSIRFSSKNDNDTHPGLTSGSSRGSKGENIRFSKTKIQPMRTEDFKIFKNSHFQTAYFNIFFAFLYPLFFSFCFKKIALENQRTDLEIVNAGIIACFFNAAGRICIGFLFQSRGYLFTAYTILAIQATSAFTFDYFCNWSLSFTISLCVFYFSFGGVLGLYPLVSDILFKDKGAFTYSLLWSGFTLSNFIVLNLGTWAKDVAGSWSRILCAIGFVVFVPLYNIYKLNGIILEKQAKDELKDEV